jgi:SAM-dependent methyltransferase
VELGHDLASLARERLASFANVTVDSAAFEDWDDGGRTFDLVAAASSWHWIDPSVGWSRAHHVLRPNGWLALLGHVVVQRPEDVEVFAETVDLHERFMPNHPAWGHPPSEEEVRTTNEGWGPPNVDRAGLFGPTTVRWYPMVQWFDAEGFADHLRSLSIYRTLDAAVREPLLNAIAERIRTELGDRVLRRYLAVLRMGRRSAGGSD